jgi:hypothetical protein
MNINRIPILPVFMPAILALSSCSQMGPNDQEFKLSLQRSIPSYWEVQSVQIEGRENRGSNTVPQIQSRFKASVKLKEDTFRKVENYRPDGVPDKKMDKVVFISPAAKKGTEIMIFGQANSGKYMDSWKTSVDMDGDPLGQSPPIDFSYITSKNPTVVGEAKARNQFISTQGREDVVVINSSEEVAWKAKINQQVNNEKKQLLALLLSQNPEGNFFMGDKFRLDFNGAKPESKEFTGKIIFKSGSLFQSANNNVVKEIRGTISYDEIKFTSTKLLEGNDDPANVGGVYTFPLSSLYDKISHSNQMEIEGKYAKNKKIDKIYLTFKNIEDRD